MNWLYKPRQVEQQPTWLGILFLLTLVVALIFATCSIIRFLALAGQRMVYPFELEWIEGAVVDESRWLLDGHALYAEPVISFVPTVYNPLFFVLSAAAMKILGIGFAAPRLVAIVSTIGCFLLLYLVVVRASRSPIAGLLAAGFYAATFRFSGAWMDIAKPDSLFLFLVLLAHYVGQRFPSRFGMIISGLLFVTAYYAKQSALLIILILASVSMTCSRGRTWLQWLLAIIVSALLFWVLDTSSDGWFSFYTFDMVVHHEKAADIWYFWRQFISKMWPAMIICLAYVAAALKTTLRQSLRQKAPDYWLNLSLAGALIASSWSVFLQRWTYDNGFMPACAGLGILFGLGFDQILRWTQRSHQRAPQKLLLGGTIFLTLCQFYLLRYSLAAQLPSAEDRKAGEQFITDLSHLPGEVLVYDHGFTSHLAGKATYLQSTALSDARGSGSAPPRTEDNQWRRKAVQNTFKQAITQQKFDWIIVDQPETSWLPHYLYSSPVFEEPNVFQPVTGARSRPESLMVKNPVAQGGNLPLAETNLETLFIEGWSSPEDWGRWAAGQRSALKVALEPEHSYGLTVQVFSFCPPSFEGQTIKALWNDSPLGSYTFPDCEETMITFTIPSQLVSKDFNILSFEFGQALSPAELGLSGDQRSLAVGFRSLSLVQE